MINELYKYTQTNYEIDFPKVFGWYKKNLIE